MSVIREGLLDEGGMPTALSHNGKMVLHRADGTVTSFAVFPFRGVRALWWRPSGTWEHVGMVDVPNRMVHVRAFGAPEQLFELAKLVAHPVRYGARVTVDHPYCRACNTELVRDQDVREGKHAGCL